MSFAYYDEGADETLSANFAPAFISFLDSKGYTIDLDEKLGQGSSSVAFQGIRQEDDKSVALVITPWEHRSVSWFKQLSETNTLLSHGKCDVAELYDYLIFEGDISTNTPLESIQYSRKSSVQVMELLPRTLAEYMYSTVGEQSTAFKAMFLIDVYKQVQEILARLEAEGLTHTDVTPENIAFTDDKRCVLLDLESIQPTDNKLSAKSTLYYLCKQITKFFNAGAIVSAICKDWKNVGGICTDEDEQKELRSALEQYVKTPKQGYGLAGIC